MLANLLKYFVLLFVCLILYYIIPKKYRWIAIFICSIAYYYLMSKSLIIYVLMSVRSICMFGRISSKINDGECGSGDEELKKEFKRKKKT